jgi:FkbM family methyltransferase
MNSVAQAITRYSIGFSMVASSRFSSTAGWTIARSRARIALENIDDLLATYDVYANRHYDRLNKAATPGSVVWDIGANIGATSLIFAQNPNIVRVYAYEPLPHTFECAKRTLACNPTLARKIDLVNLGVGAATGDLNINYTKKAKCAIGVSEIPPRLKKWYRIRPEDMEPVAIHLVDADEVLRSIRASYPEARILLKLDAEGAEYGIIDRLSETGAIGQIENAAIEWHMSPGEPYLTSKLRAAGFLTSAKVLDPWWIGMIDAWKV